MKRSFLICLLVPTLLFYLSQIGFATPRNLKQVKSWGYLLQNVTATEIHRSPFDLVVIEPQLEADANQMLDPAALAVMKTKPGSTRKRIVLAYLSIGEAEDYRPYWQQSWKTNPPTWLGQANPNWEGNYKVRFWDPEWQAIMIRQVEKLLAGGFDGIYLDIVDAWYYWADPQTYQSKMEIRQDNDPYENPEKSALFMVDWLARLSSYTRSKSLQRNPDFLVFPQNGEFLLHHLSESDQKIFWQSINGIGVEDLFFFGESPENNPLNIEKSRLPILRECLKRGKQVLSVEYISQNELVVQYKKLANKEKFIPYRGSRLLDRLIIPQTIVED